MKLTHIDLFSGIGGFSLAARWAGLDTIVFCERDKFCQKVLNKHWPGVPIHDDITTFDGTKYSNVFLLTGGFPCQPFSCAGKRRGKEDDRYLWPEMLRVIQEIRPRWIIGENVAGFIGMGLDDCISDLESEGYEVQPFIIPACAVNAPHRRDRVWIVANNKGVGCGSRKPKSTGFVGSTGFAGTDSHAPDSESGENNGRNRGSMDTPERSGERSDSAACTCNQSWDEDPACICGCNTGFHCPKHCECEDVTNTSNHGLQGGEKAGNIGIDWKEPRNEQFGRCPSWQEPWVEAATRLCRVDDGLPRQVDRVNRLKALGNAVVPQIPFLIMTGILDLYT